MLTRGAGPRTTLPSALYCDPWHGHLNLFSFCTGTPGLRQGCRILLSSATPFTTWPHGTDLLLRS